jgi:RNA-binding protein NOB1
VAASVDSKGKQKLHLSAKRKNDIRGTKFSLPKPGKQNRFAGDLLLREDQLLMGAWNTKVKVGKGQVESMFGADIIDNVGLGDLSKRDDIKVGMGRQNPNQAKAGRERRGKAKKNSEAKACGMRRAWS